jgi:hypothetical protein
MRAGVAGGLEQLGHYLRIGLAVEAHFLHFAGVTNLLSDCSHDRSTAGASRQQDGSIDVEKDESVHEEKSRV